MLRLGNDVLPGHHFYLLNHQRPLNSLTFAQTGREAVELNKPLNLSYMNNLLKILAILSGIVSSDVASKDHEHSDMGMMEDKLHSNLHPPSPLGVMGNMHHEGFMFSIRHGLMKMNHNISNGNNISNSKILEMPTKLSVIPENMDMKMTMVEGMYAPSNNLTLMVMGAYLSKEMRLSTYSPMMERDFIGHFNTSSSDLSDITLSALFKISEKNMSKWHGEVSYQKSVGSADQTGKALTPMGTRIEMIMPYAMQSGDDATRVILGLTNTRQLNEKIIWGNQIKRKIVVNNSDWSFGDQTELNSWLQYSLGKHISFSSRLKFLDQEGISGRDSMIVAPVQTANPDNYGGKELHFGFGINWAMNLSPGGNDLLAFELLRPLIQNKNNLQMKSDHQIILGYTKSI